MDDQPIDSASALKQLDDDAMRPYYNDLVKNILRIAQITELYKTLKGRDDFSSDPALDDILRSCVVFAHAMLEEFLRRLAVDFLPMAGNEALNNIPLATTSGRAEKFKLGQLAEFKGKTVEEVINASVLSYYERSNFNNTTEISLLLEQLGLDVSKVNHCFAELDKLMERRHLIVHRMDKVGLPNENDRSMPDIEFTEVSKWPGVVARFVMAVIQEVTVKYSLVSQTGSKKTG